MARCWAPSSPSSDSNSSAKLVCSVLHLPIPGPVVGMILLAVVLAVQARKKPPSELPEVTPLDTTAGVLLRHTGLLFIRSRSFWHV